MYSLVARLDNPINGKQVITEHPEAAKVYGIVY